MEAPLIGPPTSAPRATVAPIASPVDCPINRGPVATARMTSTSRNVRTTSHVNACQASPAGPVTPRGTPVPSDTRSSSAAPTAPAPWASQ